MENSTELYYLAPPYIMFLRVNNDNFSSTLVCNSIYCKAFLRVVVIFASYVEQNSHI